MWLSCVWSERHESLKEQNKAFKLLSCSYQKKQNSSKKKKKKKQNKTHSRRQSKEEDEEAKKKKMKNNELRTDMARRSLWILAWISGFARYGLIRPESARVSPIQRESTRVCAESTQVVWVDEEKKKDTAPARRHLCHSRIATSDASATVVLPCLCILVRNTNKKRKQKLEERVETDKWKEKGEKEERRKKKKEK